MQLEILAEPDLPQLRRIDEAVAVTVKHFKGLPAGRYESSYS